MAKSAGNFQRITELEEVSYDPLAFRYLCLTARYSRQLGYSSVAPGRRDRPRPSACDSGSWARRPRRSMGRRAAPRRRAGARVPSDRGSGNPGATPGGGGPGDPSEAPALLDRTTAAGPPLSSAGRDSRGVPRAVEDDLDMPTAIGPCSTASSARTWTPMSDAGWSLGPAAIPGLDLPSRRRGCAAGAHGRHGSRRAPHGGRGTARARREWSEADRLRDALRDLGLEPVDLLDGTSDWRGSSGSDPSQRLRGPRDRDGP